MTSPGSDPNNSPGFTTDSSGTWADPANLPTTGTDFDGWTWRQIEAAICGGAAVPPGPDGEARKMSIVDPSTVATAAGSFFTAQQNLANVAQVLTSMVNQLVGDKGSWQGPAATQFGTMMNKMIANVQGRADQLSGGSSRERNVGQLLYDNAFYLDWAQRTIAWIDVSYAQVVRARGSVLSDGAGAISSQPDLLAGMTRDMNIVADELRNKYQSSLNPLVIPDESGFGPNLPNPNDPGVGGPGPNVPPPPNIPPPGGLPNLPPGGGGGTGLPNVPGPPNPNALAPGGGGPNLPPPPGLPNVPPPTGLPAGLPPPPALPKLTPPPNPPALGLGGGAGGGPGGGAGGAIPPPNLGPLLPPPLPGESGAGNPLGGLAGGVGAGLGGLGSALPPAKDTAGLGGLNGEGGAGLPNDSLTPTEVPPALGGQGLDGAPGGTSGTPPFMPPGMGAGGMGGSGSERPDAAGLLGGVGEPWVPEAGGLGDPAMTGGIGSGTAAGWASGAGLPGFGDVAPAALSEPLAGGVGGMPPFMPPGMGAGGMGGGGAERPDAAGLLGGVGEPWVAVPIGAGDPVVGGVRSSTPSDWAADGVPVGEGDEAVELMPTAQGMPSETQASTAEQVAHTDPEHKHKNLFAAFPFPVGGPAGQGSDDEPPVPVPSVAQVPPVPDRRGGVPDAGSWDTGASLLFPLLVAQGGERPATGEQTVPEWSEPQVTSDRPVYRRRGPDETPFGFGVEEEMWCSDGPVVAGAESEAETPEDEEEPSEITPADLLRQDRSAWGGGVDQMSGILG